MESDNEADPSESQIPQSQGYDEIDFEEFVNEEEATTAYLPKIYTKHYGVCLAYALNDWIHSEVEEEALKSAAQEFVAASFWDAGDNAILANASTQFMDTMITAGWAKRSRHHNKTWYRLTNKGRKFVVRYLLIPESRRRPPPPGEPIDEDVIHFYKAHFVEVRKPKNFIAEVKKTVAKQKKRESLKNGKGVNKKAKKKKRPNKQFQPYHIPCIAPPEVIIPDATRAREFADFMDGSTESKWLELGVLDQEARHRIKQFRGIGGKEVITLTFPTHPDKLLSTERYMVAIRLDESKKDFRTTAIRAFASARARDGSRARKMCYETSFNRVIYLLATENLDTLLRTRHEIAAVDPKDSDYKVGESKQKLILPENIEKYRISSSPCPQGIYACDFEAILIKMDEIHKKYRRENMKKNEKEEFRYAIPEKIVIFEADMICEEDVTKNWKSKNKNPLDILVRHGWIKRTSPPVFPGMKKKKKEWCYVITSEGINMAKKIAKRNRDCGTEAVSFVKKPSVYFKNESERQAHGWKLWESMQHDDAKKDAMSPQPKEKKAASGGDMALPESDDELLVPPKKKKSAKKKPQKKSKKRKEKAREDAIELDDSDDDFLAPEPKNYRVKEKPSSTLPPEYIRRNSAPPTIAKKSLPKPKPRLNEPNHSARYLAKRAAHEKVCHGVKCKKNQLIVDYMWEKYLHYRRVNHTSKRRTYEKVTDALCQVTYEITRTNAHQLTKISGIKQSVLSHILEILETGELSMVSVPPVQAPQAIPPPIKKKARKRDPPQPGPKYTTHAFGIKNKSNKPLILKLHNLGDFYGHKKDFVRRKTFHYAASQIAQTQYVITLDNYKELKKLEGVAAGTLKRVKEFLTTGSLKEMDSPNPPKRKSNPPKKPAPAQTKPVVPPKPINQPLPVKARKAPPKPKPKPKLSSKKAKEVVIIESQSPSDDEPLPLPPAKRSHKESKVGSSKPAKRVKKKAAEKKPEEKENQELNLRPRRSRRTPAKRKADPSFEYSDFDFCDDRDEEMKEDDDYKVEEEEQLEWDDAEMKRAIALSIQTQKQEKAAAAAASQVSGVPEMSESTSASVFQNAEIDNINFVNGPLAGKNLFWNINFREQVGAEAQHLLNQFKQQNLQCRHFAIPAGLGNLVLCFAYKDNVFVVPHLILRIRGERALAEAMRSGNNNLLTSLNREVLSMDIAMQHFGKKCSNLEPKVTIILEGETGSYVNETDPSWPSTASLNQQIEALCRIVNVQRTETTSNTVRYLQHLSNEINLANLMNEFEALCQEGKAQMYLHRWVNALGPKFQEHFASRTKDKTQAWSGENPIYNWEQAELMALNANPNPIQFPPPPNPPAEPSELERVKATCASFGCDLSKVSDQTILEHINSMGFEDAINAIAAANMPDFD